MTISTPVRPIFSHSFRLSLSLSFDSTPHFAHSLPFLFFLPFAAAAAVAAVFFFRKPKLRIHIYLLLFSSQLIKNNLRNSNYVNSFVCALNTASMLLQLLLLLGIRRLFCVCIWVCNASTLCFEWNNWSVCWASVIAATVAAIVTILCFSAS